MIQAPPKYEIDLDEGQRFIDLRQYTEFPYPDADDGRKSG
jgi:hypothetical protein